jgi:hypothetical protein
MGDGSIRHFLQYVEAPAAVAAAFVYRPVFIDRHVSSAALFCHRPSIVNMKAPLTKCKYFLTNYLTKICTIWFRLLFWLSPSVVLG